MDQPDREVVASFTQPWRQLVLMLTALALVALGSFVAFPSVGPVFLTNPQLNGFILLVFFLGVAACFMQVQQLVTSVNWIEGFVAHRPGHQMTRPPRLLAPLAALLRSRRARSQIGSSSASSILESVATRIDEARDITRYIVNLLIFLGLLGTFFGLATTVPGLIETIKSLAPTEGEGGLEVFTRLMGGLEKQLDGMGTAFASSLLGLSGSLVVGLLELFAGHGQNRFYRELEEWMSTITKVGFSSGESDGKFDPSGVAGLLDHMAEQMESMQTMFTQSDVSRSMVDEQLGQLAKSMDRMTEKMANDNGATSALIRMAEGQEALLAVLQLQAQEGGAHVDAESRMRLRSIDVQLLRILEEMSAGRQESITDLRTDLAGLTRAIRQATQRRPQTTARPAEQADAPAKTPPQTRPKRPESDHGT